MGKGWGGLGISAEDPNVHLLDAAPHDRLFPLMSAVVHHGGAGTTFAGLTAGKPTFVVPQFFDQPYWGQRVHDLGCGPKPVHLRNLTGEILASALVDMETNANYAKSAAMLGEKLRAEDGAGRAVEEIEALIATYQRKKIST